MSMSEFFEANDYHNFAHYSSINYVATCTCVEMFVSKCYICVKSMDIYFTIQWIRHFVKSEVQLPISNLSYHISLQINAL